MFRYFFYAVPLIVLLLALFSLTVGLLDAGPAGALTVLDLKHAPLRLVLGTWLLEALGLVALYLLIEGRSGRWWFDGLMAGWVAWIFRGPLLVVTVAVAAGKPQAPWFKLILGWWVLYTLCGLALALLARRPTGRTTEEVRTPEEPPLKATEEPLVEAPEEPPVKATEEPPVELEEK